MSIDSITKGATIKREKTIMDWPAFILSIAIVLVVSIPIIFWPDQATAVINAANVFVLKYFGGYYMVYGLAAGVCRILCKWFCPCLIFDWFLLTANY